MSRARVEIINGEEKLKNFEDLECGTVFGHEGHLFLKTGSGFEAVLLTDNDYLGSVVQFDDDDLVVAYDNAVITVRTRAR